MGILSENLAERLNRSKEKLITLDIQQRAQEIVENSHKTKQSNPS
jgi:ribosomal protein L29